MTDNLKKLLEEASKNEELKAKLAALTDRDTAVEKTVEIAREYGIILTAEDFKSAEDEELSLDELDAVAGGEDRMGFCGMGSAGGGCLCVIIGASSGCACVLVGSN